MKNGRNDKTVTERRTLMPENQALKIDRTSEAAGVMRE